MIGSDACSVLAQSEPLAGSAPFASAWLVVEHPGPWGRDALTDSGIPESVVHHIEAAVSASPVRFLAARRFMRSRPRGSDNTSRLVWLAFVNPDGGQTRRTMIDSWEQLLEWDLAALAKGVFPVRGEPVIEPIEFVCTHSKRDTCCAVLGRERASGVPARSRDYVWECSHLGGHRFAATSLFLPSGRLYGRLASRVSTVGESILEPTAEHLRGPSYLPPFLQAAECAARIDARLSGTDTLRVEVSESGEDSMVATVRCNDGREWVVRCVKDSVTSPASCGEPARDRSIWNTHILERRL